MMLEKMKFLVVALFLGACMGTSPEGALPVATNTVLPAKSAMPQGGPTEAPVAFKQFCERNPHECKLPSTNDVMSVLSEAHAKTKALVIPQAEEGDTWESRVTPGPGDCEDFALTMRSILRGKFPSYSASFLIATAYTEENAYHAVLSIETDRGTIVCDIRYAKCAPWESYPYQWHLREVAGADHWQQLTPSRPAVQIATASSGR